MSNPLDWSVGSAFSYVSSFRHRREIAMRLSRVVASLLFIGAVLPAPSAGAATLTFPGCGPSFKACVDSAAAGSTIVLKTNELVRTPADGLEITKPLKIQAAPGFKPKLGRSGDESFLEFDLSPTQGRTVSLKGITFKQLLLYVSIRGESDGHRIIFENNRIETDSGANGDTGFGASFEDTAEGSIVIRNNYIRSVGMAIDARGQGGPITITGNRITSSDRIDSGGGITLAAQGSGIAKATIASNVISNVAGCGCGNPAGISVQAIDSVELQLRIVNNTVSPADPGDPGAGQVYGIGIFDPFSDPEVTIDALLFNNSISHTYLGLYLVEDDQITVTGDRNNTFNTADGDTTGSYDIGTLTHEDPEYMSDTNFKLASGSPLIDEGQSCIASYPLPRGDAGRKFRVAGEGVDVGGYEFDSVRKASVAGKNVNGTDSFDTLRGTDGVDVVCGFEDGDVINGKDKDDFLFGGTGADDLSGREGNDFIDMRDGSESNDMGSGGPGNDICLGDIGDFKEGCEA
jgi:hypothetical protein